MTQVPENRDQTPTVATLLQWVSDHAWPDLPVERNASFWWVNQGTYFKTESAGGYISAPPVDIAGRRHEFYDNVSRTQVGDIVFHYASKRLVALGHVRDAGGVREGSPAGDGPMQIAYVDYRPLPKPIGISFINLSWRLDENKRTALLHTDGTPAHSPFT